MRETQVDMVEHGRPGKAWCGRAWQGWVGYGMARHGVAWRIMPKEYR